MSQTSTLSCGSHTFRSRASPETVIEYIVKGNVTGKIMTVLPPAWGPGSNYLQQSLQPLYTNFAVIFLEFRSNGLSTRPSNPDNMNSWSCADDVEELRIRLALDTFPLLAGHSNGSEIALWYAARYPDRVDKLLLICHPLSGYPHSAAERQAVLAVKEQQWPTERQKIRGFKDRVLQKNDWDDQAFTVFFREHLGVYLADPSKAQDLADEFPDPMPVWNYHNIYDPRKTRSAADQALNQVKAKTYIFLGLQDPVCTSGQAEAAKEGMTGTTCEIFRYDNSGHFPWVEAPALFWGDFFQATK